MKFSRRRFIKNTGIVGAAFTAGITTIAAGNKQKKLTILHTNDVHSQIEPLPKTDKYYADLGGFARRAELVSKIRSEEDNVLLLDAGDFFQGTAYFNYFKGELEVKLMSALKYDAAVLGNHEFDNGTLPLYKALKNAEFTILSANYEFKYKQWNKLAQPFKIFNYDGVNVGVIGVCINNKNLIDDKNFDGITYQEPTPIVEDISKMLKEEFNCSLVIALSHLGIKDDRKLASNTSYVDVILGGHSHTLLKDPELHTNKAGGQVLINQVGSKGAFLGRIDIQFSGGGESSVTSWSLEK